MTSHDLPPSKVSKAGQKLASDSSGIPHVLLVLVGNTFHLESDGEDLGKRTNALAYLESSAKEMVQIEGLCSLIEEEAKEFFRRLFGVDDDDESSSSTESGPSPHPKKQYNC